MSRRRAVANRARATARPLANGLTVREATESDLAIVVELRLALLDEHRRNLIYRRTRPDLRDRARDLYLAQLRSPREVTLLAERGDEVVGILRCVESTGYPILLPANYGYVSSAYVRESARREGVLTALMDAAIEWCRDRGLSEMRLHSTVENESANSAWDALGFEVVEHLRVRLLR